MPLTTVCGTIGALASVISTQGVIAVLSLALGIGANAAIFSARSGRYGESAGDSSNLRSRSKTAWCGSP